ncbi:MAG: RNA signal recognition particle [Bdellovibrionales bacterium RIFCSPHIGHO2_01_FULL_40_29]|nr:MAG: RNA signal recognition particle [Bdellovibrionales bacterium RIFCSPHIGHO2_01_FULL_40_29]OFZ34242.1 MAG: RNA signal recognition particle [Bdellovibrionales bacterium RIFCSPHIGHO2_02_FULL_40_15]
MALYVDGFVVPVPKKNIKKYEHVAKIAGRVWKKHGALEYKECLADDVKTGKYTSFPQSVKLKPNEVVFFSWIVYKSRAHRDKVMKKVMADPKLKDMGPEMMPFDGKRMIYGGFKPVVSL